MIAIKPGAVGEATSSHIAWEHEKLVPFCASPVYYGGTLFTVKDGGIVSSLDTTTGKPIKQGRLPASNDYFASPVAGDGKLYFLNDEGKLTVLSAEGNWSVLAEAEFGEPTYATPALVDGRIYLRTQSRLYCFATDAAK